MSATGHSGRGQSKPAKKKKVRIGGWWLGFRRWELTLEKKTRVTPRNPVCLSDSTLEFPMLKPTRLLDTTRAGT